MDQIEGVGVTALPFRPTCDKRQSAAKTSELVVDKDAADVVLFEQVDGLVGELLVRLRQINQVRSAVGGDDEIGL